MSQQPPSPPETTAANGTIEALQIGEDGLYVMRDQRDVLRVAQHLLSTGAVPSSLRTAQQVAMAVQGLKSLGLNPYASIRQVGFINGALTIWGDLPLALARKTGLVEDFREFRFTLDRERGYERQCFKNSNAHLETFGVVCRIKRLGQREHEVVFTQEDARKAGLWGKTPTWQRYPARMMQMRARSQALKDIFSDALAGVQIQEFDIEGVVPRPVAAAPAHGQHLPSHVLGQLYHLGLTPTDLREYLGHDAATCTSQELEQLRSLAAALRGKQITWVDALASRKSLHQPPRLMPPSDAAEPAQDPVPRRRGRPPGRPPRAAAPPVAQAGPPDEDTPSAAAAPRREGPEDRDDGRGLGRIAEARPQGGQFVDDDLDGLDGTAHLQESDLGGQEVGEPQPPLTRMQQLTQRVSGTRPRR